MALSRTTTSCQRRPKGSGRETAATEAASCSSPEGDAWLGGGRMQRTRHVREDPGILVATSNATPTSLPTSTSHIFIHTKFGDPHLVLISLPDPLPDLRLSIPGSPSPPTGFRTAYASPQSSYRRSNQSLTNHGATHAQRLACTVPQTLHFLAAAAEDLIAPPWVRDYTPSIQVHCLSRMLCLHTGTVVIAQIHRLRLVASDLPKPASLTTTATSYRGRRF